MVPISPKLIWSSISSGTSPPSSREWWRPCQLSLQTRTTSPTSKPLSAHLQMAPSVQSHLGPDDALITNNFAPRQQQSYYQPGQRNRTGLQLHQPRQPNNQQQQEVCRNFQRGACRFGDRCRRLHPQPSTSSSPSQQPTTAARVCYDFAKGTCQRANCKFIHVDMGQLDRLQALRQRQHVNILQKGPLSLAGKPMVNSGWHPSSIPFAANPQKNSSIWLLAWCIFE